VRYPSEYQYDKLPGAINVPLAEVRNMFAVLDRSKEYVAYCQSGRRSAAAASSGRFRRRYSSPRVE